MDIKQLKYFIAIVEEGGFNAAAKKLFIAQPSLSKSIKNLEKELGCPLFRMEKKHIQLTSSGMNLYEKGKVMVENFDDFYHQIRNESPILSGCISIGIPPIIGTCALPELLNAFHQAYPQVRMSICQNPADTIQQKVANDTLDIGFVILPVLPNVFDITTVVKDKNVVVVRSDHPLASYQKVDYSQLSDEHFILLDNQYILVANIVAACREHGFEPDIVVEASTWDFIVELIKNGIDISILPKRILDKYPNPNICQIELDHPSSRWDVVMIVKKSVQRSILVRKFVSFVQHYLENHQL